MTSSASACAAASSDVATNEAARRSELRPVTSALILVRVLAPAASCQGSPMRPTAWRIAADVARETAANAAMALPPVRAWRLRRPRAGASVAGAPGQLDRYAFQAL